MLIVSTLPAEVHRGRNIPQIGPIFLDQINLIGATGSAIAKTQLFDFFEIILHEV